MSCRFAKAAALIGLAVALSACSAEKASPSAPAENASPSAPRSSLQVLPVHVMPGGQVTVRLRGVPGTEPTFSGEEAALQSQKNGQWSTIYALIVITPANAGSPAFMPGERKGPVSAVGIRDPAVFRLPPMLKPGRYRIERSYSYGSQVTVADGLISVTK